MPKVSVPWWPEDIRLIHGGVNLSHLDVYYDFDWDAVFRHEIHIPSFPRGKALTALIKRDCPEGKTAALFLTSEDEVDPWIYSDETTLIVAVPVHDYLAHSVPDAAASYYAHRYGRGLTASKDAVVRHGLTIEDIDFWRTLDPKHVAQLRALLGADGAGTELAGPDDVRALADTIVGLDADLVEGLVHLFGEAEDRAETVLRLDALIRAALDDEDVQSAFLQNSREVLVGMLRAAADAPDIVALAARREALRIFERLLTDADYFEAQKTATGKGDEGVWQAFIEKHPWVIGTTLAPQFLHSWSMERLEQTVVGASVQGPGKRPDAFLTTAGAISAVVFAEIKSHRTDLLGEEYRTGCWRVSREVAGGVAQCQGTVDEAQHSLGKQIAMTDEDGFEVGRSFVCRPRSLLIVGTLYQFVKEGHHHNERFQSFERFRRGLRDPEILTFDELFERARLTLDLVAAPVEE